MKVVRWIDSNLYLVPWFILAGLAVAAVVVRWATGSSLVLQHVAMAQRGQLYSALVGSAAGLLGFVLAAISILYALSRSLDRRAKRGRVGLVKTLLSTSVLLLILLILSLVSIVSDSGVSPRPVLATLTVATAISSSVGLSLSLIAFALVVLVEQGRD